MLALVSKFMRDESGATAIEYGLIAALISVVIIGVLTFVGTDLKAVFTNVDNGLKAAG
jgi:pilus assembly protein Flp/PilA